MAAMEVAERVVGRSRNRRQRKATAWWNGEVKEAVKRKKELYRKVRHKKHGRDTRRQVRRLRE